MYIYLYIYIYIQPLWPHIMLNIGWWCSEPIAEAKGSLWSVPGGLCVLHYPCCLIFPSICPPTPMPHPTPPLLNSHNIYNPLFPPPPRHPCSQPPCRLQAHYKNRLSRYVTLLIFKICQSCHQLHIWGSIDLLPVRYLYLIIGLYHPIKHECPP